MIDRKHDIFRHNDVQVITQTSFYMSIMRFEHAQLNWFKSILFRGNIQIYTPMWPLPCQPLSICIKWLSNLRNEGMRTAQAFQLFSTMFWNNWDDLLANNCLRPLMSGEWWLSILIQLQPLFLFRIIRFDWLCSFLHLLDGVIWNKELSS